MHVAVETFPLNDSGVGFGHGWACGGAPGIWLKTQLMVPLGVPSPDEPVTEVVKVIPDDVLGYATELGFALTLTFGWNAGSVTIKLKVSPTSLGADAWTEIA